MGFKKHRSTTGRFVAVMNAQAQKVVPRSKLDPTKTSGLRRRAIAALRSRYRKLGRMVRELLQRAFVGRITQPRAPTGNAGEWEHETNPNKLKRFRQWLRDRMGSELAGDALIQTFIDEAYRRGTARGFADLRRSRASIQPAAKRDGAPLQAPTPGTAWLYQFLPGTGTGDAEVEKQNYTRMRMQKAPTVEKVKMLASRTFSELEDINTRMAAGMSRALAEGLARGDTVNTIANRMVAQTGIAFSRATTITRTELIRAHAEGQLDTLEDMGEKRVGVAVEWQTAGDSAVCPRCSRNEGQVFKIDEARGLIPVHPNCRCAWVPLREK